jgi:high affinity choline transporter 7
MSFEAQGLIAIILFYGLFFAVGSMAARIRGASSSIDEFLLAGRNLPLVVGVLTMVATWVGGGYINGTAEAMADPARGLVWAQAPWGYALSLIVGGLFFAGPMRKQGFRTLLDLFADRYGPRVTAGLFVPALLGEIFWSAAILVALGTTLGTILDIDFTTSILLSAAVAIGYTMMGGLRSVAYTDVLQLVFIVTGLGVAVVFAIHGSGGLETVLSRYSSMFSGSNRFLPPGSAFAGSAPWGWQWADVGFLLVFGGIPWQVYFQRVLACRDERSAIRLSVLAGFGCLIAAVPAALIGVVGGTTDWAALNVQAPGNPALTLPWVLLHLTPHLVALLGLSAIAAAVMSSVDSSILSASSMFAWNIYRPFMSRGREDRSIARVTRVAVLVIGSGAAALALAVQSVYTLWALCSDLVYVILFPQLLMALFYRRVTRSGAVAGAVVGLTLRLGGGEPLLGIDPILPYPMFDATHGLMFPFRTFAMVAGLVTIWGVSKLRIFD